MRIPQTRDQLTRTKGDLGEVHRLIERERPSVINVFGINIDLSGMYTDLNGARFWMKEIAERVGRMGVVIDSLCLKPFAGCFYIKYTYLFVVGSFEIDYRRKNIDFKI